MIEFYQTRTNTKMTIAAERLAVIAAVTLPITALSSIMGMNVIVNDSTHVGWLVVLLAVMPVMSGSCWSGPGARAGGRCGAPPDADALPAPPALFVIDVDGTLLTSAHEVGPAAAPKRSGCAPPAWRSCWPRRAARGRCGPWSPRWG